MYPRVRVCSRRGSHPLLIDPCAIHLLIMLPCEVVQVVLSNSVLPSSSAFMSAPPAMPPPVVLRATTAVQGLHIFCPGAALCSCCRRAEPGTDPGRRHVSCNAALLPATCLLHSLHGQRGRHALPWTLAGTTGTGHCCPVSFFLLRNALKSSLHRQRV